MKHSHCMPSIYVTSVCRPIVRYHTFNTIPQTTYGWQTASALWIQDLSVQNILLCPCLLANKQCGLLVQLSTIEVPTVISGLPAERSRLKNHKAKLHPEFTPSLWCRPLLLSGHGGIIIIIRLLFNWTREQHATHQVAPNTSAHSPNNIVWYQGNRCKRRVKTFEVDSVQLLTRWHQILTVQRRASSCDVENY